MSRKSSFVKASLDDFMSQDTDVQRFFTAEDGKALARDNPLYAERKEMLEHALNIAYDAKAQTYNKEGFLQKYIAKPLRALAGGLYAGGTGLFLTLAGPAGFGLTGLGVLSSSLADVIDYASYKKQGQIKGNVILGTNFGKLAGESLFEKALGYLPIGTGLLDLYRGRKKFDAQMKKDLQPEIKDTLDYAKELFIRKMELERSKDRRIIPLKSVRDERYTLHDSGLEKRAAA